MARSNRRTVRTRRPIFIMHRGGGASPEAGTFTGYFAAVPGGKADLALAVVQGEVRVPLPPANRDLEPFDYAVGAFGLGQGGFGWAGAALLTTPYIGRAGFDSFETYAVGPVTGAELNAGSGWAEAPLILAR